MLDTLETLIYDQMNEWSVPGIAIGLKHGNQIEFGGYGVANMETGAPVAPETLFQIGSISKIFTATLVMTLVDREGLDLNARVVDLLPEFRVADADATGKILVRHLLTHRAGFYGDRFDPHGEGDDALARAIAAMGDLKQQTPPGEFWTYCNAGWDVLGRIVEKTLGTTFEAAMRERVFEPMGLDRSTYFASEAILHSAAVGHRGGGDEPIRVATPWPIPRRSNAAGGVSSNVLEVMRFAVCHVRGGAIGDERVLSEASSRLMQTKQVDADYGRDWGLGWIVRDLGGLRTAEHSGATNGFMARLITIPEEDFVIVVLTNGETGTPAHSAIANAAMSQILGITIESPAVIDAPAEVVDRFVGKYAHDLSDIVIAKTDNGLTIQRVGHDPFSGEDTYHDAYPIVPISETEFKIEAGPEKGNVAELFLDSDGSVRFLRIGGRLGYPQA